jgi:hypothetical protein
MRRRNDYYTLVASLPPLPRFDRARRLPINRVRLFDRLNMLAAQDAQVVEHAAAFFGWNPQPAAPQDRVLVEHHEAVCRLGKNASFLSVLEFPFDLTTLVAGLRRRHLGRPRPAPGEPWGVGRFTGQIVRNWEEPDFRLGPVLPWLPRARALLEQGEALALEKLLFSLVWGSMDRVSVETEFSFDSVLAYLFKWDLLDRWLTQKPDEAQARFQGMVTEAMHGKERLFA